MRYQKDNVIGETVETKPTINPNRTNILEVQFACTQSYAS